jgi:N-succinyldiaminopimelate aminotransferase
MTNPHLAELHPYPFEKLAQLKSGVTPPADMAPILLSIGEPKHETPRFIMEELAGSLSGLASYPTTIGTVELRETIASWLTKRFNLPHGAVQAERNVLPVNGTREALFAFAQCFIDSSTNAHVLMPNPFYQIYEGAALLAGAKPYYINATQSSSFNPDFESVPDDVWKYCQLLYLCSPGNPTGAVVSEKQIHRLLELSAKHNFIIASDECYSEIYPDENNPPVGLLQAATTFGLKTFDRCVVFHSLSKRSSVPGMRSGFVAGDQALIERFKLYRTYHGCSMSPPVQAASLKAWSDEAHVVENRDLYRAKFKNVLEILSPVLDVYQPDGSFYLWPRTPVDDQQFARDLFGKYNVTVLPGSYLSRTAHGINPGENRVRMALVPPVQECIDAANRIKDYVRSLEKL